MPSTAANAALAGSTPARRASLAAAPNLATRPLACPSARSLHLRAALLRGAAVRGHRLPHHQQGVVRAAPPESAAGCSCCYVAARRRRCPASPTHVPLRPTPPPDPPPRPPASQFTTLHPQELQPQARLQVHLRARHPAPVLQLPAAALPPLGARHGAGCWSALPPAPAPAAGGTTARRCWAARRHGRAARHCVSNHTHCAAPPVCVKLSVCH